MANQLGFHFRPTHQECILYLAAKVMNRPFPSSSSTHHNIILDLDPYDVKQLQDIFTATEEGGHLFFFTKLSKKGRFGSNYANRTVGEGSWRPDCTKGIERRGREIGKYTKLSYREKGSKYDHRFLMTEYTLPKNTKIRYDPLKDYVLCHLKRNDRWKNGKRVPKCMRDVPVDDPTDSQVDQVHHVAESMELPSYWTSTEPVYDHQPQVMDNGCRFSNHDRDPLQYAPDPYSCHVESAQLVPRLQAPSPAAGSLSFVVETGLPPLPSTIDCSSFYSESAPFYAHWFGEDPVAPLPYDAVPANTDPNYPRYLPEVESQVLQTPDPAVQHDDGLHNHLMSMDIKSEIPLDDMISMEELLQPRQQH